MVMPMAEIHFFTVFGAVLKWYLYFYSLYFFLIVILSAFTVKLGGSRYLAHFMSNVFRFIERSKRKLYIQQSGRLLEENDNCIERNDRFGEKSRPNPAENTRATVDFNFNRSRKMSELLDILPENYDGSNTIERDIILSPELNDDDMTKLLYTETSDAKKDELSDFHANIYHLADILSNLRAGIEAIIEDQITSRFEAQKLTNWNLLTRNNPHLHFYNWKVALIWFVGVIFRYFILFPIRLLNCILGIMVLFLCMSALNYVPESSFKKRLYRRTILACFQLLTRWLGCALKFHNTEFKPQNGIAVSNHTTPFDVLVLNSDNCYAMTGQKHDGFIGFLEKTLNRASPHVWFDRSSLIDREVVVRTLQKHASEPENPPILIFPEGTCINNTAVMQFKKGAFEVGTTVYPIAIKYDTRFGNVFWNSSKQSALQHVFEMMTSWSVVCNVWYLPPMKRQPEETAVHFANRVKRAIAKQIRVVDLIWDGQVKRMKPKSEWKELQRKSFYLKLCSRMRNYKSTHSQCQ